MGRPKVTIPYLQEKKLKKELITMLTCYDYPMAVLEEKAGIEIILDEKKNKSCGCGPGYC